MLDISRLAFFIVIIALLLYSTGLVGSPYTDHFLPQPWTTVVKEKSGKTTGYVFNNETACYLAGYSASWHGRDDVDVWCYENPLQALADHPGIEWHVPKEKGPEGP